MAEANKKPPEKKEEGPRSFIEFLRNLSNGEAESNLAYELHELGKAMQEQSHMHVNKVRGSLTLEIRFITDATGAVGVVYHVKTKHPKPITTPAMVFLTKGGNFSPESQRQMKLGLRDASAVEVEVRDANDNDNAEAKREIF